jgi:hypothetical protein
MSQLVMPGPRRIFTPALPKSRRAGRAKASLLKFLKNVRSPLGSAPTPTTLIRAPSLDPVVSCPSTVLKPGVNGAPLMNEGMPLSYQLFRIQVAGFPPVRLPIRRSSYSS